MLSMDTLQTYLYYGYVPTIERAREFVAQIVERAGDDRQQSPSDRNPNQLVQQGLIAMRKAFDAVPLAKEIVLPLSGGLDSRAILANLLERVSPSEITTVTFGMPGALDYELGRRVARAAGTRHEQIDLTKLVISTEALVNFAREYTQPNMLLRGYYYRSLYRYGGQSAQYWSGFLGEVLTGSHLPERPLSWEEACLEFNQKGRYSKSSHQGVPLTLPEEPLITTSRLTPYDHLDIGIRQGQFIRPHIKPPGYHQVEPLIEREWVSFILGTGFEGRKNQRVYRSILAALSPKLYSIPVKNDFGLPITASPLHRKLHHRLLRSRLPLPVKRFILKADPRFARLNYISFENELRSATTLRDTVFENIQDLKKRGVVEWINIDEIWQAHQNGTHNHLAILDLLLSLEIHLKQVESSRSQS